MNRKMITIIPVKEKTGIAVSERPVTRVAAYARVSTLSTEQEESYESQKAHFEEVIGANPNWKMSGIYSDQASGLSIKKRTGFQKMMKAAKRREFDTLLVKSISRFGRNTLDTISSIRELKSYGINCRFEKEQLDTGDNTGEMLLTLLSAFAQSESESISMNTTLGFRYKHARGEWSMTFDNFLGYKKNAEGNIVIEEEGAETVREIYRDFLDGISLSEISRKLESECRLTGAGGSRWTKTSLSRILNNEKYCGDARIQKYVMGDVLSKKRVKNEGQAPMYYIEDDHPAIVTRQKHLLAKGELMRREMQFMDNNSVGGPSVLSGKYDFTYKIFCPECGANYNHRNARGKWVWECYNRINADCNGEIVKEEELKSAALTAAQILYDLKPEIGLNTVPTLKPDDSDEKLIEAAVLYSENTFAQRIIDFLNGDRPTEYMPEIARKLIERIDIADNELTVKFYGTDPVKVPREAGAGRSQKGRRLNKT